MTKVRFDLISKAYIYLFFEKGMRGKVFYNSKRYNKVRNKHLKPYAPKNKNQNILYTYILRRE